MRCPDCNKFVSLETQEPEVQSLEVVHNGGRYAKSYFGAVVNLDVRVGGIVIASVEWSDKIAASDMDELV